MDYKQKAVLTAVLAALVAATTAPIAASHPNRPGVLVIPLVLVAILLCFAGYFAGLSRR